MAQTTAAPRPLSVQVDNRLLVLIAVVAGHAIKHVFNAGSMLILPELKSAFGVSNTSIGLLTTTRSVFGGLINLPAGFVSDRYSGRWAAVLALTLIGVGVSMFLVGISPTFWMAVISMTLLSMAITFWHPPALAALSVRYPDKRGVAVAMHGTGGSIGEAVGPILTGFLIGFLAWRTILELSLIPAVLMGIGIYLLLKSVPSMAEERRRRKRYFGGVKAALGNSRLLLVLATTACFSGAQIGIMSFLPIYAREDLQMSTTATGALVSLLQVAGIGSQPVLGYLSDMFGRRVVLAIGFARPVDRLPCPLRRRRRPRLLCRRGLHRPLSLPDDGHPPCRRHGRRRKRGAGHDGLLRLRRFNRARCRLRLGLRPRRRRLRCRVRLPVRGGPRCGRLPAHGAGQPHAKQPRPGSRRGLAVPHPPDEAPRPVTGGARPTPSSVDIGDEAITIVWNDGHQSGLSPPLPAPPMPLAPPASARAWAATRSTRRPFPGTSSPSSTCPSADTPSSSSGATATTRHLPL